MNAETLKLYIALQPQIKKLMGKWQLFDWMFNFDGEFSAPITTPEEIEELNALEKEFPFKIDGVIRLPLPIDPNNKGRGLWDMVDWGKWQAFVQTNGKLSIYNRQHSDDFKAFVDTPELALLKAIASQENVNVF